MGILQAVLAALNIMGKFMDMFTKAQADKEAEIRVSSKVRRKVDELKKSVNARISDKRNKLN